MKALHHTRLVAFTAFWTIVASLALVAGFLHAAPLSTGGGTGQALALRAALRSLVPPGAHARTFAEAGISTNLHHASDGRFIFDKAALLRPALQSHAIGSSAQINEAVQTQDVFSPPPTFTPPAGATLTPTNLTPVWTADETMLVFSSNRTPAGIAGTRFHIWAIAANGGVAVQLTTSVAQTGETAGIHGEFFPALSAGNNSQLAFTSDSQSLNTNANTANVPNLYTIPFSATTVSVSALTSPTISQNNLGFQGVQRPAFAATNSDEIVFSALSTNGQYNGHYHLYFLFVSTGGYDPASASQPAKLTDGPADDTDPSFSQDGQLIAFASTAAQLSATGLAANPNPNTAPVMTAVTSPASINRSIFVVGGGGRFGFGTVPNRGVAVTLPGTDNFGPAWSSTQRNPYTNPAPGFEYIAFARGASPTANHDIYYLQLLQSTDANGETSLSNEAATTPLTPATPVYQLNAGAPVTTAVLTGPNGTNSYVPDQSRANGVGGFFVNGGTADVAVPPALPPVVNTSQDPGTPPQIYNTDRSGTFTYTFRNLTPKATYHVRLHLSDPKDTTVGARIFNVTLNGNQTTGPIDIVSEAGGGNTAVVNDYVTTVPTTNFVDNNGLITAPSGAITVAFNPVSGDPPIVQGIEIISDSTVVATTTGMPPTSTFLSSGFGTLAGTGFPTSFGASAPPFIVSAFGGVFGAASDGTGGQPQVVIKLVSPGSSVPSAFNVYRSLAQPTAVNSPPLTGTGTEGSIPFITNAPVLPVKDSQGNPVFDPSTGFPQYSFTDTQVSLGSEYFYEVTAVFRQTLAPESATNPVIHLNTDDNANQTSTAGNAFNDIYPTWSPFLSVFSIAYSSNRTVTYNDPATGTPSETAISVGQGGSLAGGGTVGAAYRGLLESQVVNLDPPTLIPYSGNEILHVADSGGVTTRTGITPGQAVTVTVRLSSREAGVDDSNVYLQIKDPDSKYQDAQGLEHKVFAHDAQYRFQSNNPNFPDRLDSGSSDMLINGGGYNGFNQFSSNGQNFIFRQRGSIGGLDAPPAGAGPVGPNANKDDTISVGRDGGGTNANQPVDNKGAPIQDANKNPVVLSGGDPSLFIPWGPEFECQVVNPQFAGSGGAKFQAGDTAPTDYRDPYFLAGIDDQQPFSGNKFLGGSLRPTTNGTDFNGNPLPAEWLPMTRLPAAQQDGQGGVLYSVNWTTPISGSDYYLDVIAFDKAIAPQTAVLSGNAGSNWRIYDNVWGFSTAASIGNNDILVVSDYALGQKFAATTFGGQRGLLNLVPKLYGAESYVTDIDVNRLPNAIYRTIQFKGANNYTPEVFDLGTAYDDGNSFFLDGFNTVLNGLGVGSYNDTFIDDGSVIDGRPAVHSQLYSLWRILSRGPVPASLYKAYQPTFQAQPAVNDPTGNVNATAGSVPVANRCILWFSPFTGDVLAGPGTLADTATQANLRSFVLAGGRLCVSGQDVGSTLTQGGTTSNGAGSFISDVLGATLKTSGGGTHLPNPTGSSGTDNRITNLPFFDAHLFGNYPELNPGNSTSNIVPGQRPILISNNFGGNIFENMLVFTPGFSGNWRTDGSLDQLGPYIQPFPANSNNSVVAQIDTITPNPGAHVDISLNAFNNPIGTTGFGNNNPDAATEPGGVGLIYTETPISTTVPGTGGSKVVYSTFGLEALSTEYYRQTLSFKPNPVIYVPRNQRQNIMHNIVDYLRTGSLTGTVRATSGNGVVGGGVAGATIYVQDAFGAVIPGRGVYSATSDAAGNFRIDGMEPGNYTLVALKGGFVRATSNPGIVFTIEGDTTVQASLTLTPAATGSINGNVADPTGKIGIAGATVSFVSSSAQTISTTTDANGNYSLPTVSADTYSATASKSGSASSAVQAVTVVSNAATTANFTLAPGPGTATGTVRDPSGNPVSGATVFFSIGSPATVTQTTANGSGVYTISLTAGTYTAIGSAAGFTNSTPINVVIAGGGTTSQDITLGAIGATGTLGGLVTATTSATPLAGATLTVVNTGTGQTVTPAPTTTDTATTGPDNGQINYGPLTLQPGNYTVTVSKNGVSTGSQAATITGGAFTRLDFTGTNGLPPLHTFASGLNFLSLPFDYSGFSFDAVFGVLNTAPSGTTPNGNRSHVAVWDPTAANGNGQYALDPTPPADAIRLGVGYWVYLKNPVGLTQAAAAPSGTVTVALHPAWNQIGVPSAAGVLVSNLKFDMGGGQTPLTFAQAASSQNHVVSPTLFRFDGAAYQAVVATDTLQPYQAYWIKVFTPTTLDIPTGH